MLCSAASAKGLEVPLEVVGNLTDLEEPALWRSLQANAVLTVTWHRMSGMLTAIRESGARTIAIADTDGEVSYGVQPDAMWRRLSVYASGPRDHLRRGRYFVRQWLRSRVRGSPEDAELVASTRASDVVILGNTRARDQFAHFLRRYGAPDLVRKLRVVPFTIAKAFLEFPLDQDRPDRIVAIGRWEDPQKHASLLASALDRYLDENPEAEVHLVGSREPVLEEFASSHSAVRHRGLLTSRHLAELLSSSRILLSASRWEGSPHAVFEALALGVTLVGPPISCFQAFCSDEDFGTVAESSSSRGLARALANEHARWQSGERDPMAISRVWRSRLEPARVCEAMLEDAIDPEYDVLIRGD